MAEKLGHPYRAASLLNLFSNFLFGSFTSKQLAFTPGYRETSQNQHPQGGPFPIPKLGLGNFNCAWIEMLVRSVYT